MAETPLRNTLVAGASGSLGSSLLATLSTLPTFTMAALTRTTSRTTALPRDFLKISVRSRTATFLDSGTHKFAVLTLPHVALATARVLQLPTATANRFLFFQDFACSQRDVIDALERLSGQTWQTETVAAGDMSAMYDLLAISFAGDAEVPRGTRFEEVGLELANDLVGCRK